MLIYKKNVWKIVEINLDFKYNKTNLVRSNFEINHKTFVQRLGSES